MRIYCVVKCVIHNTFEKRRLPIVVRGGIIIRVLCSYCTKARDVASFCVVFHTIKRGFELSVAVASQVLHMTGGKGLQHGAKFLPSGFGQEELRLPRNLRGSGRGRVPIGDGMRAMGTRRGVRVPAPGRS